MSISALTTEAIENGTYMIVVSFLDEDDQAVTPNADTIVWTLSDRYGNPINSREDVAISSSSSVTVVLSGDDLQILSNERRRGTVERRLSIYAEYDSDEGSDLPLTDSCKFNIRNLRYMT